MKFSEIVQKLGNAATCNSLTSNKDCNPEVSGLAAVDEASPGTLSYIEGAKFSAHVGKTDASALILPQQEALQVQAQERGIAWIATAQPRLLFAQAIALFLSTLPPSPRNPSYSCSPPVGDFR